MLAPQTGIRTAMIGPSPASGHKSQLAAYAGESRQAYARLAERDPLADPKPPLLINPISISYLVRLVRRHGCRDGSNTEAPFLPT
jgi:hypothetical protein